MHFNVEPGDIISTLYYDTEICSIQNNETCKFLYYVYYQNIVTV